MTEKLTSAQKPLFQNAEMGRNEKDAPYPTRYFLQQILSLNPMNSPTWLRQTQAPMLLAWEHG
jgi:hypothetical protein